MILRSALLSVARRPAAVTTIPIAIGMIVFGVAMSVSLEFNIANLSFF